MTGKPEKLMDLKGTDLLGLPVKVRPGRCAWSLTMWSSFSGLIVLASLVSLKLVLCHQLLT